MSAPPSSPSFEELARLPDDAIDVALGAMLVAKDVDDDLDVDAALRALRALGEPLAGAGLAAQPAASQASAVSARFRDLGFRGNVEDYYDPRNSLLPDVVTRRLGIPITLSVVWCEMARQAGIVARGVAFPGHFLVRVDAVEADVAGAAGGAGERARPIVIDPFAGGRVVEDTDARELLRRALGDGAEVHPSLFTPATPRGVLVRMLGNLKAIWAMRGDHARAFVAIDRIVTLVPDSARMLRERADVALKLGVAELARKDLARVLELEPQAPDAPVLKARLAELGGAAKPTLN